MFYDTKLKPVTFTQVKTTHLRTARLSWSFLAEEHFPWGRASQNYLKGGLHSKNREKMCFGKSLPKTIFVPLQF